MTINEAARRCAEELRGEAEMTWAILMDDEIVLRIIQRHMDAIIAEKDAEIERLRETARDKSDDCQAAEHRLSSCLKKLHELGYMECGACLSVTLVSDSTRNQLGMKVCQACADCREAWTDE